MKTDEMLTRTFNETEDQINAKLDKSLKKNLTDKDGWSLKEKLALSARILGDAGHATTLAGQITVKAAEEGTYWSTNLEAGIADASVSSLVRYDHEMTVLEGHGIPNPGVRFHLWVYASRPEVNCIVHTHPPHTAALSMLGEELVLSHMDTMVLYEDCGHLPEWPGVPLANEEGVLISGALSEKNCALLAHHGLITVGETIEQAVYRAFTFEYAARIQLLARGVGEIKPVNPDLARKSKEFLLKPAITNGTFNYWARQIAKKYPDLFD